MNVPAAYTYAVCPDFFLYESSELPLTSQLTDSRLMGKAQSFPIVKGKTDSRLSYL